MASSWTVTLTSQTAVLAAFEVIEELSERFETPTPQSAEVQTAALALGPLVEVLLLRRAWRKAGHELLLRGRDDARHTAIRTASSRPIAVGELGPTAGAFHITGNGQALEFARHDFVSATGKLARDAGMPHQGSNLLKACLGELMENVTQHAGAGAKGLAAYEMGPKTIALAVADTGQGVVQAYVASQPKLKGLCAMEALEWAVRDNRSRFREPGRGTGFSTVVRAMRTMDAALRVRSDDASIEIEGAGGAAAWISRDQPWLHGFVVSLQLRWQ